jgi:MFS family permease
VSVGITVAAILSGRMLRTRGRVRAVAIGACLLSAASFAALALVFHLAPDQVGWMSLFLFPLGLGIGALFPLVTVVSQFSVPPHMIGVGTSTPIMVRTLGGALGIAAMGSLLAHGIQEFAMRGAPESLISPFAAAFAAGIQPVYEVAALVCLLGAAAALFLPERLAKTGSGTASAAQGVQGAGAS